MIKQIIKKEGIIKGFYKGFSVNAIKAPIGNGTAWTVKNLVNRNMDEKYEF